MGARRIPSEAVQLSPCRVDMLLHLIGRIPVHREHHLRYVSRELVIVGISISDQIEVTVRRHLAHRADVELGSQPGEMCVAPGPSTTLRLRCGFWTGSG